MYIRTDTSSTSLQRPSRGISTPPPCLDCLFWHKCKIGMIDCELKRMRV